MVSLRDGILILTTNKHEFSDRITGWIRYINRRERKGRRVYKYMHVYLWSALCFEIKIARIYPVRYRLRLSHRVNTDRFILTGSAVWGIVWLKDGVGLRRYYDGMK